MVLGAQPVNPEQAVEQRSKEDVAAVVGSNPHGGCIVVVRQGRLPSGRIQLAVIGVVDPDSFPASGESFGLTASGYNDPFA